MLLPLIHIMPFLPTDLSEAQARGWRELDIIIVSGDAYVDHPSFGAAIIGRWLEAAGYRVGILPQPDWSKDDDFLALGRPRLFFGITGGNMDSLVNHYTAQRKRRNEDAYSPDGAIGRRPDRAVLIYANILKRLFKGSPIVLGGIEASLRRIAHYDFWQNKVRASILSDSKADLLVYGMGEQAILQIANALSDGLPVSALQECPGTVVFASGAPPEDAIVLPDSDSSCAQQTFLQMTRLFQHNHLSRVIHQRNGGRWIRHNPPAASLSVDELDSIYSLPYEYLPHPRYEGHRIPAFDQIKDSLTSHRGCYGGCNFCALTVHQGRRIQSRSAASLLSETKKLARIRGRAITITDVGGPTANMYRSVCAKDFPSECKRASCLFPSVCTSLKPDHSSQLKLLQAIRGLPEITHVFVASGIRHDLALLNPGYIDQIASNYTGGRLKLAPEHSSPAVLRMMGKPSIDSYEVFARLFLQAGRKAGIRRQILPYLIIGHPGTTIQDALELRQWLVRNRIKVEQVQEFTPTPMTVSTCMYYTGLDFWTGKPIHIPKPAEIRRQKELALWHLSKN